MTANRIIKVRGHGDRIHGAIGRTNVGSRESILPLCLAKVPSNHHMFFCEVDTFTPIDCRRCLTKIERMKATTRNVGAGVSAIPTTPDGRQLTRDGSPVRSLRDAESLYLDEAAYLAARVPSRNRHYDDRDETAAWVARCLSAIAHTNGTTVDEERDRLASKVIARMRRNFPSTRKPSNR